MPVAFEDFFHAATGHDPYAYQTAFAEADPAASVLNVPTGAGKTQALIVSWLYGRHVHARGPRRLVYALPMRTLVEQTVDVAEKIRNRLELSEAQLTIHPLMGGLDRAELKAWQEHPERNQVIVGTIDMLLSRALNRGYASSRFMWPVPFGLLNNDCRWVFDEVQLMGAARATSAQLEGLRRALGTVIPCETIWVSATVDTDALATFDHPAPNTVMSLPDEDRHGALKRRLEARKQLTRVDLSGCSDPELARTIAAAAVEHHRPGARTLVVLNTVALAQATFGELRSAEANAVLLHSRFRPPERAEQMAAALGDPGPRGTIVVATQVIEAGVDTSACTLLTESAPFSSIVQRVGRCNREGEHADASVVWLDRGALPEGSTAEKTAAPYDPEDVERARNQLLQLVGTSLSPAALSEISVEESRDDPTVLRRRDLLDLFDTSPDLSGMDIDVAPFIREDDERNVAVLFREISGDHARIADEPPPQQDELVQVPLASLGKRLCWMIDRVDGGWLRRTAREVPAGATVMLRAADGGYDPRIGWDGKSKTAVEPRPHDEKGMGPDGVGSDLFSVARHREQLLDHLTKAASEADHLSNALELPQWRELLRIAGALHDIGKGHPVFQETLRRAMFGDSWAEDEDLWAKSDTRSGRYARPFFRHELASALAIRKLDTDVFEPTSRDLLVYLVAAHHGKVRLSIRPAPDEQRPTNVPADARFAVGIVDGDTLPAMQTPIGEIPEIELDLASMELGAVNSWTDAAVRLRDDPQLGPFRLGYLEALLRIADWRASDA